MIYSFMVPELLDGPLWNKYMPYDVECCRSNWWTNMLAIQNIVNRKDMVSTLGYTVVPSEPRSYKILSVYELYVNDFSVYPIHGTLRSIFS